MIEPKKVNIRKFLEGDGFHNVRVNLSVMYLLLSYVELLKEDNDDILKGYEGIYIGRLKGVSQETARQFDHYVYEVERLVRKNRMLFNDDYTEFMETMQDSIEENKADLDRLNEAIIGYCKKFFFENRVKEEPESSQFVFIEYDDAKLALNAALKHFDNSLPKRKLTSTEMTSTRNGFIEGFNVAVNWINRVMTQPNE